MARSNWTTHRRVLDVRRQWPFANTLVMSVERFRVHRTGRNSALVAHYGFLSVFPLMLVFTTILGFVLQDNEDLQQRIIDSVLANFPIIGSEIEQDPTILRGSVPLLVIGLLTALWAGLKAFNVLQMALDDIADMPLQQRPNAVKVRLQSLIAIVVIGGAQVAAAMLSGLVSATRTEWGSRLWLLLGTLAINTVVLGATYHWLCTRRPRARQWWPGAVFGGFAFTVFQVAGATLMTRAIVRANPIYGSFATVIGLMFWLGLHSMVALLGAELNTVLPIRPYRDADGAGDEPASAAVPRHRPVRLGTVVMGADDVDRAVTFWSAALGYEAVAFPDADDEFTILVPPDRVGTRVAVHRSVVPVQDRPRVHIDLVTDSADEQQAEVARLRALGATSADWDYPDDPDFVVLADPEGNRFCVIDAAHG